jgi:hypothetical protein
VEGSTERQNGPRDLVIANEQSILRPPLTPPDADGAENQSGPIQKIKVCLGLVTRNRYGKAMSDGDNGTRRVPNAWQVGALLLFGCSLIFRFLSYNVMSSDYTNYISKWFDALQSSPSLSALGRPLSDYAPLYLYFLKALTLIPVSSL